MSSLLGGYIYPHGYSRCIDGLIHEKYGGVGAGGAQGSQGPVGAQGSQGVHGAQGSQGSQGTGPGSVGTQGSQGAQGSAASALNWGQLCWNAGTTNLSTTAQTNVGIFGTGLTISNGFYGGIFMPVACTITEILWAMSPSAGGGSKSYTLNIAAVSFGSITANSNTMTATSYVSGLALSVAAQTFLACKVTPVNSPNAVVLEVTVSYHL